MNLRCLIVDDSPTDAEILRRLLRDMGVTSVSVANTLTKAADVACEQAFDVMLLDLHLPDSNGTDTVAAARLLADIPVIVVTGADLSDEEVHEVMQHGAMGVLDKHTLNGNLRRAIQIVVSRQRIARQEQEYIRSRFAEVEKLIGNSTRQ